MNVAEVNPKRLTNRRERACAKIARIARDDVRYGGVRAMVIAERLWAMGSSIPAQEIVGDAYADRYGNACDYLAHECGECGTVHAGRDAAERCCSDDDDWEEEGGE